MERYIVIGDIHGCYDELMKLLGKIHPSRDDVIISIGDMIDRGPQSPEVVTFFMKNFNTIALFGNHERKHVRYSLGLMPQAHFTGNQRRTVRQFEERGGKNGLASYAEALDYFKTLPLYLDLPWAILVHAGLIGGVPLELQNEKILAGVGFKRINAFDSRTGLCHWCETYPPDAKPVIFGHISFEKASLHLPERRNLWPIDTGCVSGGYLTAVTLPDFRVYQARSRYKKQQQQ